jgi:hypothetical protein
MSRDLVSPDDALGAKPDLWAALAADEGGLLEMRRGRRIRRVVFPHVSWEILLDEYTQSDGKTSQTFTRCRVRFGDRQSFRLRILADNVFLKIAKRFGLQDVSVPAPDVDARFVIRTNNESVVHSIVLTPEVRRTLLELGRARVDVSGVRRRLRRVPGVSELRCQLSGRVKEPDRLRLLVRLTRAMLDALARTGVATTLREG